MLKNTKKETIQLLFESSRKTASFNIYIAFLLILDLGYQKVPCPLLLGWFLAISIVCCCRAIYCKQALTAYAQKNPIPMSAHYTRILSPANSYQSIPSEDCA